ncbi:MAG TPA: preprotein translocase subunit SecG [Acetobacteraceae bacterium]|nr:preprotein translocase subunit SecG [Acetobacteraceae bacterium]
MSTVLLIVELFVTLALIGIVLIQRSEGGGLGIGGSQGMGSFMSGRGTANLLTRTTAVLATIFMALALALGLINRSTGENSILNSPPPPAATSPAPASAPSSAPTSAPTSAPGGPAHSAPPKLPTTPALPALPAVPTK